MPVLSCHLSCDTVLGAGTSGQVYALDGVVDGKSYAAKVVSRGDDGALAEAKLHSSLPPHDSIVQYHFAWTTEEHIVVILERVDSELYGAFASDAECMSWSTSLLSAVSCLHDQGIVHRDINPWNCFLRSRKLKLGDLGLAAQWAPHVEGRFTGWHTDGFAPLDDSAIGSLYSGTKAETSTSAIPPPCSHSALLSQDPGSAPCVPTAPELGDAKVGYSLGVDIFSAGMTLFAIWHACVLRHAGAADEAASLSEDALTTAVESVRTTGRLPPSWPPSSPIASLVCRMVDHCEHARPTASAALAELSSLQSAAAACATAGEACDGEQQKMVVGAAEAAPPQAVHTRQEQRRSATRSRMAGLRSVLTMPIAMMVCPCVPSSKRVAPATGSAVDLAG